MLQAFSLLPVSWPMDVQKQPEGLRHPKNDKAAFRYLHIIPTQPEGLKNSLSLPGLQPGYSFLCSQFL